MGYSSRWIRMEGMRSRKCRKPSKIVSVIGIIFIIILCLVGYERTKSAIIKAIRASDDLHLPDLTMFNISDPSQIPINTHKFTFSENSIFLAPATGDKLCGGSRLGNKMFMIATTVTTAQRSNVNFALPECEWSASLLVIFPNLRNYIILPKPILAKWKNYEEAEKEFTHFQYLKISQNSTLDGYRQTWKYFSAPTEQEQLRKLFKLNPLLLRTAQKVKQKLLLSVNLPAATTVGVHVRIGDLLEKHVQDAGYRTANLTFYRAAFEMISNGVKYNNKSGLVFVVASDSVYLAQKMLKPLNDIYKIVFTHQTDLIDFSILTLCDHSVISGGTYSFWSAFLAGGHVVYNDHYLEPDSKVGEGYDSLSFMLPEWRPL